MSKYRATRRNFLPPPRKHVIVNSPLKWTDTKGAPWLFDKDVPDKERKTRFKDWPIFQSDQWSDNWLIVYTIKTDGMPQVRENIMLSRGESSGRFLVVKWYPSTRAGITYLLTINQ